MTKILILKGSPREHGNSSTLADQVAAGAVAADAQVESFFLQTMNIRPCDGCDACRAGERECIVQDDMYILYPKLREADAIVVASPIYWFTMSAQTKTCIDRWYALDTPHGHALTGKRFAFILTYADPDPFISGASNALHTYQDMCRYLRAEIVGMVYGSVSDIGDVQKQPKLMEQAYRLGQKLASGV